MQSLGEHERLVRFLLGASSGVHLVLARYEHAGVARRARAAAIVAVRAGGREVAQVDFGDADDEVDIVGRLQAANARAPIVFAFGLEGLLLDLGVAPRATDAIARFNFDRDLLPERLHGVVVLWLSYRAARAFASLARDTFDVISTSFDFPELLVGGEGESEFGREFVSMDSLPEWATRAPLARVPELEDRARLLESLYVDATPGSAGAAELAVSLGKIESSLGHVDAALEWFDRAARDHEQAGEPRSAAINRCWRAGRFLRLGRLEAAELEIAEARVLARSSLDSEVDLEVQLVEAQLEHARENPTRAREILDDVVSKTSDVTLRALAMRHIAGIQTLGGEFDAALATFDDLVTLFDALGRPCHKASTEKARAAAFSAKHDYDAALKTLREDVLPAFEVLEDLEQQARTSWFIATILAQRGEYDQAIQVLSDQTLPLFERFAASDEQARARELLAALEREREAAASKDRG